MSLLLLFHPRATGTPTPPEPEEPIAVLPGDAGAAAYQWTTMRRRRLDEDEDDLLAVLAAFLPMIGRR